MLNKTLYLIKQFIVYLYILLRNEKHEPANVWIKTSKIANVTESIISQAVTLAGIPTETVINLNTTYIC